LGFVRPRQAGTKAAPPGSVRIQVALLVVVIIPRLLGEAAEVPWTAPSSPGAVEGEGAPSRELSPKPDPQSDSSSREFSFELREGLIWVEVNVPRISRPLNFLLDTGAGASALNLDTVKRLGLPLGKRVTVQGVRASSVGYWPERLAATAGEVALPRDYLAVDLNELGDACHCRVDGLLGADFFRERVVQIDFRARKVRLLTAGKPRGETLPLRMRGGALQVPVAVDGVAARWARLDTGCASSLQWVTGKRTKLSGSAQDVESRSLTVAVGLAQLSVPVEPARVQLGSHVFSEIPTGRHSQPIFSGEAGLLGNGLLSRFERVTLDVRREHLYLEGAPPSPSGS